MFECLNLFFFTIAKYLWCHHWLKIEMYFLQSREWKVCDRGCATKDLLLGGDSSHDAPNGKSVQMSWTACFYNKAFLSIIRPSWIGFIHRFPTILSPEKNSSHYPKTSLPQTVNIRIWNLSLPHMNFQDNTLNYLATVAHACKPSRKVWWEDHISVSHLKSLAI